MRRLVYAQCPGCGTGRMVRKSRQENHCKACAQKISGIAKRGIHCSPGTEFKKGNIQGRGADNPNWRGGRTVDPHGYVLVKFPEHPFANNQGYVFEHRLAVEKRLDRYLTEEEIVHHDNENPADNWDENLILLADQSEHTRLHNERRHQCP